MALAATFAAGSPMGLVLEADEQLDMLVVTGVAAGSQGEACAVRVGQVVTSVQGKVPKGSKQALQLLQGKRPLAVGFDDEHVLTKQRAAAAKKQKKPKKSGAKGGDALGHPRAAADIPRSPFGQRWCVLTQPAKGDLGMRLDASLVVEAITRADGPAAIAGVPIGWQIMAVGDTAIGSSIQFAMAVTQISPGGRLSMLCYPATEQEKMSAVATKWAAIHHGRHARNPPPDVPDAGPESSENDGDENEAPPDRSGSGSGRFGTPSKRALRRQRACEVEEEKATPAAAAGSVDATPKQARQKDRTGRWYTAPTFTPGQELALCKIQAVGRGHIARLEIDRSLSLSLSRSLAYEDFKTKTSQPPPSP